MSTRPARGRRDRSSQRSARRSDPAGGASRRRRASSGSHRADVASARSGRPASRTPRRRERRTAPGSRRRSRAETRAPLIRPRSFAAAKRASVCPAPLPGQPRTRPAARCERRARRNRPGAAASRVARSHPRQAQAERTGRAGPRAGWSGRGFAAARRLEAASCRGRSTSASSRLMCGTRAPVVHLLSEGIEPAGLARPEPLVVEERPALEPLGVTSRRPQAEPDRDDAQAERQSGRARSPGRRRGSAGAPAVRALPPAWRRGCRRASGPRAPEDRRTIERPDRGTSSPRHVVKVIDRLRLAEAREVGDDRP